MLRRFPFIITLAASFLVLSGVVYYFHYFIFRDVHHIFIYMVGDLAFLPLEVLLVVLIIERVLARRDQQAKLQKLNMVVGAFFTEVGTHLLNTLFPYFNNKAEIAQQLISAPTGPRKISGVRRPTPITSMLRLTVARWIWKNSKSSWPASGPLS